jgi:hypothetical protein
MLQTPSVDFGRSLKFFREDANYVQKLAIGLLIGIVPILNFAGAGYGLEVLKNTGEGRELPLPTWDNIGDKFVAGLKLLVPTIVYSLPSIVMSCITNVAAQAPSIMLQNGNQQDAEAAGAVLAGLGVVALCLSGVQLIYSLFLQYLLPAVQIQFVRSNYDIGATLRFREVWQITQVNSGEYFKSVLLQVAFGILATIGVLVTCFLGFFVLVPLALIIPAHLTGQYKRIANL